MEERQDRIVELITKFRSGTALPEEIEELEAWYASFESADTYSAGLDEATRKRLKDKSFHRTLARINRELGHQTEASHERKIRLKTVTVAVLLLITVAGGYHTWQMFTPVGDDKQVVVDAMPGGNKATLMLSDGTEIDLDSASSGYLAVENGMRITKSEDGQILYEIQELHEAEQAGQLVAQEVVYNTITTPSGGQYTIVLPDGTTVWMNASSSLRYPTRFSGGVREVELDGEAYFSVTSKHTKSSQKIPFVVITPDYNVEVTGTEFNVNAYPDEASVSTTLVSGSVDIVVKQGSESFAAERTTLEPHQQATLRGSRVNIEQVDVMTATGWKDGFFYFDNTDLYTLVRQLSRWYNVEVKYARGIKNDVFFGKIPRQYTLAEALKVLELGNVRFRIVEHPIPSTDGRKLLVFEP
ncbi:FecR family protein [Parapedobacter sp. ISTM3]|uniref:FecR family protein n=1 Tax=Parapedobacter sp. ISTM3 TaxID=2800130 RepID=UPI001903508C|nr:FecR family protein [Parapedobacter sp. ISTM3]MBK1440848.1 FecR family protein [Parapedobacter sp. ISTM3]